MRMLNRSAHGRAALLLAVSVLVASASSGAGPAGAATRAKGGIGEPRWLGARTTDDGVTLRVSAARFDPSGFPPGIPTSCYPDLQVLVGVSTARIAETVAAAMNRDDLQPQVQVVGTGRRVPGGAGAQVVITRVPKETERVEARFVGGQVDDGAPIGRWAVLGRRVTGSEGRTPRTRAVRVVAYDADDEVLERVTVDRRDDQPFVDLTRPECRPTAAGSTVVLSAPAPPLPEPSGPPPADEAAARDAVIAAVEGAYAAGGSGEASLAHVQDGDSAAVRTAQETSASRNEQYRGRVAAKVSEVRFLDAEEAAVHFELLLDGEPFLGSRVGFVVLTADGWKLSRSTYCAVLAAGGGQC